MRLIVVLLLLLTSFKPAFAQSTVPRVVTSLHPLKLITDQLMMGVAKSESLIPIDSSPHHFQFKPSQIQKTMKADLLIWISNDFETGLKRLQQIIPDTIQRLELQHQSVHEDKHHDKSEHHEGDGHIWLSSEQIIQIAQKITSRLSQMDPTNATIYQTNLKQLTTELINWEKSSQQRLGQINTLPSYIVDHDFLSYFERSFGLAHKGALHQIHEHGGRLKSLSSLHDSLKLAQQGGHPVKCLLIPQSPASALATQIQKQYQLKLITVNILGQPRHKNIIQLLDDITRALENCR